MLYAVYQNSVGIGEHPQHLEEIDKLLQNMVVAQEKSKRSYNILKI